jgi:group I intron endonuclease
MYVGSAIVHRIGNRFHKHLYSGKGSTLVWAAVQKYGLSNFAFIVIESVSSVANAEDNTELMKREDFYINTLQPKYNIAQQAGNTFGVIHTLETKTAMRLNYSSERREAIGSLNRDKKLSLETIEAMQLAAMNRPLMSKESRDKISAHSAKAQLYTVSRVDGSFFISPSGNMVQSDTMRTLSVVSTFIGCSEKTVVRGIAKNGIVKKDWLVELIGKANNS